jgi:AcrR family transcriptional regulator
VADEGEPAAGCRPRADAERNRLRLLGAAKAAFTDKGSAASLDEIARAAGVGIGTLYRHFPTRDALIAAVYRNETDQLVAAAARLAKAHPPVTALREWLLLFVDYMGAKQGMAEALSSIVGGGSELRAASGAQAKQAIATLVEAAVGSGEISLDIDPLDLLRALAGVVQMSAGPDGRLAAKRLVDILIAGVRTSSGRPPPPIS